MRKKWLLLFACIIILSGVTWKFISVSASNEMTEKEIKKVALQYAIGTVESLQLNEDKYEITMKDANGAEILLILAANTGELLEKTTFYNGGEMTKTTANLENAKKIALEKVIGTIQSVVLNKKTDTYTVEIDRGKFTYSMKVSSTHKKIIQMKKFKNKNLEERISKKEVKKIALDYVKGKIKKTKYKKEEGIYYLIIEKEKKQYTIQVDPYKKSVLEVTYNGKTKTKVEKAEVEDENEKSITNSEKEGITNGKEGKSEQSNTTSQKTVQERVQNDKPTGELELEIDKGQPKSNYLTIEQANVLALKKINGAIQSTNLNETKSLYIVEVALGDVIYSVQVNAITGATTATQKNEQKAENITNDKDMTSEGSGLPSGDQQDNTVTEVKILTEQEVSIIALSRATGIVTKILLIDGVYDIVVKDDIVETVMKIDSQSGEVLVFSKKYID